MRTKVKEKFKEILQKDDKCNKKRMFVSIFCNLNIKKSQFI